MTTADLQTSPDLPSGEPPTSSPDGRTSYLPWLVLTGLLIWALGYLWFLGDNDWGRSRSNDIFNASWACAQFFLAFAGYGIARLLAETPGVIRSWRRFIVFGFTGFLLLITLAQVVLLRDEIRVEQHIRGPFNLYTGSTAMQVIGLCLAVVGMIVTYVTASRTPKQPQHDDSVFAPQSD
jgi:hypothetical protein